MQTERSGLLWVAWSFFALGTAMVVVSMLQGWLGFSLVGPQTMEIGLGIVGGSMCVLAALYLFKR